ncbi:group I truncated hemoglobin [Steroidobacter sp.]|uniref:group I truncated hemoglobin n=1 Tax=Steroidobacter sp. TaxID=1978227 RepID=UPI001A4BB088|nr:group 1 truncated hemoglobin [Steroidobacter sp.]MBL8270490.1 group 1 truncated hemoglobin [Steroidobacter sp.]
MSALIHGAIGAGTVAMLLLGAPAHAEAALYDRIGGERLTAIANDLVDHTSSDPRTSRSWHKVSLPRVKGVLSVYLCSITGGPCEYQGDTMKDIHAGLKINEAEMFAMVQSLRDIMIGHGVPLRERNELLALLAPTKKDVVTK